MKRIAFDNNKYIELQSVKIEERIKQFDNKLYLEFGGKLFDDFHASRVLPGFMPDSKISMLMHLKDSVEMVIVINANDIEKNKIRGDLGITYDQDVLRLIDAFSARGLYVGSVVISQFANQSGAIAFKKKLESLGVNVFLHYTIDGYPSNVDYVCSDEGFGRNEYIETTRELVVITAPGPGSGKMATCLSQLYHDHKRGIKAGYAKFETFPIWNLPLNHPVNLAYEAATADLNDVNMIDPYHLEAYNELAINYNRDVEVFPVLKKLFTSISGESPYKSPTDMGVNMIGYCIVDDEAAREASHAEIIRRYFEARVKFRKDQGTQEAINKIEMLMNKAQISVEDRAVVMHAREKSELTGGPCVSIELNDGTIVTGKTSKLLGASSAALLNALKQLSGINDELPLISKNVIEPIQTLKTTHLGNHNPRLHTDEILIALTITATNNPLSAVALDNLKKLKGCEVHSTVLLSEVDLSVFNKLGMHVTCEPIYQTKKLYHPE
ncbi:MAG: DUF1846 domain-containing protein [Erysipelotrichaceae bacterium]|nr:DUF1846 domain-containing protein [Erysipelotrichaceae bacterium]